jgi:uncharacterized protein YkwD
LYGTNFLGAMQTDDDETWYVCEPNDMAGYLVRAWTLSKPHYRNMTQPDYRKLGVGIRVGGDNKFFANAMFC